MAAAPPGQVEALTDLDTLESTAPRPPLKPSATRVFKREEGEDVVCPNFVEDVDRWLTRRDGKRSTLYWIFQLSNVAMALHVPFGTWFSFDLDALYTSGDTVMALGVGFMVSLYGIIVPYYFEHVRQLVRNTPDGVLRRIGVAGPDGTGTGMLTEKELKVMQKLKASLHPQLDQRSMWVYWYIPASAAMMGLAVWGKGMQIDWWRNSISLAIFFGWQIFTFTMLNTGKVAMAMAMAIVKCQIKRITASLEKELESEGSDLSEEQWGKEVTNPCRQLVYTMDQLTEGFGMTLAIELVFRFVLMAYSFCILLSPTRVSSLAERVGYDWITTVFSASCAVFIGSVFLVMCSALYGPAGVSTSCDDLKEKLNTVRISDLTEEMHKRIVILEAAMANVNHGQGIGFRIGGTVIDKKMLKVIFAKLAAVATTALPIVLAMGVTYKEEEAASEDVCTLTADHKDDLKLAARILRRMPAFSNSTTFGCDYSFTLGEMLDLLDGDE